MKRFITLCLVLLIIFAVGFTVLDSEPKIVDGTAVTVSATVTDRAMSDNLPYIGVRLEDGEELCLWDPQENVIPNDIAIGDIVEVTYGKQDGFDRYILLNVKKYHCFPTVVLFICNITLLLQ